MNKVIIFIIIIFLSLFFFSCEAFILENFYYSSDNNLRNINKNYSLIINNTTFDNAYTRHLWASTLTNGNFVVAYGQDVSNNLCFQIYNSSGAQVVPLTDTGIDETSVRVLNLSNGNFVILYKDFVQLGGFIIYDSNGNLVRAATQFDDDNSIINDMNITALSNDNFIVVWKDEGSGGVGKFKIFNPDGSTAVNEIQFYNGQCSFMDVTSISNGSFSISFIADDNLDYGSYVVYNNNGTIIQNVQFYQTDLLQVSIGLELNNNEFGFITRHEPILGTYNNHFYIYNSPTNQKVNVMFKTDNLFHQTSTQLNNGDFVIFYTDINIGDCPCFIIYNNIGNLVRTEEILVPSNASYTQVVKTGINRFALIFSNGSAGGPGSFFIYEY